jgi:hypothetical protein
MLALLANTRLAVRTSAWLALLANITYFKNFLWLFLANFRLGWKGLPGTNAKDYLASLSVTKNQSFKTLTSGETRVPRSGSHLGCPEARQKVPRDRLLRHRHRIKAGPDFSTSVIRFLLSAGCEAWHASLLRHYAIWPKVNWFNVI